MIEVEYGNFNNFVVQSVFASTSPATRLIRFFCIKLQNGKKELTCNDQFEMVDGCPRNMCECDKRFALAIADIDDQVIDLIPTLN